MSVDGTSWTIDPTTGDFVVTSEIDTITGHTGGPPITVTIASQYFDTGIPAASGHYSSQTLVGMQAPPGTNFEIQVAHLHNKPLDTPVLLAPLPLWQSGLLVPASKPP